MAMVLPNGSVAGQTSNNAKPGQVPCSKILLPYQPVMVTFSKLVLNGCGIQKHSHLSQQAYKKRLRNSLNRQQPVIFQFTKYQNHHFRMKTR